MSRRDYIALAILLALSLFFHFCSLGYGEFSNDETQVVAASAWFAHGLINPLFFGSIFIFDHPPVRVLVNVPFILFFGTSEFVLRFPHAFFSAVSVVLVYLVGKRLYDERMALLAGALYTVSGASIVSNQAQGVGIYVFFTLLTFTHLVSFLEDESGLRAASHLVWASICLSVATYTYLEAIVFLPAILFVIIRDCGVSALTDRRVIKAGVVYGFALFVYMLLWFGLPVIAKRFGYVLSDAGNLQHFIGRASGLGAFNVFLIFRQYISYNSVFFTVLLAVGILIGLCFLGKDRNLQSIAVFVFPHLFVWTFLFRNMMMHPMYNLPFIALLAAAGLSKTIEVLNDFAGVKRALYVVVASVLVLSAWHHYVVYNQDLIERSPRNLVFFFDPSTAGVPIKLGSKAAGYYIREHSLDPTEQVFTYGSGSAAFYAGRLDKNNDIRRRLSQGDIRTSEALVEAISLSPNWPKVRYLVIIKNNELIWNYAQTYHLLEAVVHVRDEPSLYIFSTTKPAASTSSTVVKSEQHEVLYNEKYGNWKEILPWFLPMAQERL